MNSRYLALLKSALSLCPEADEAPEPTVAVVKKPAIKIKKPSSTITKVKKPLGKVKQVTVTKVEKPEKKAAINPFGPFPDVNTRKEQEGVARGMGKGAYRGMQKARKAAVPARPATPAMPSMPSTPKQPAKSATLSMPSIPKQPARPATLSTPSAPKQPARPAVSKGSSMDEALAVTKSSSYPAARWAARFLSGRLGR